MYVDRAFRRPTENPSYSLYYVSCVVHMRSPWRVFSLVSVVLARKGRIRKNEVGYTFDRGGGGAPTRASRNLCYDVTVE